MFARDSQGVCVCVVWCGVVWCVCLCVCDDVMRRWSPDVDSKTLDVGRRYQDLGFGQVLLVASR